MMISLQHAETQKKNNERAIEDAVSERVTSALGRGAPPSTSSEAKAKQPYSAYAMRKGQEKEV
mgnify:CR=1 FL=1|tara:strand:+ start:522 stop:710 length:189 start_codon:yes stop_codon:yes gene_type:complete